MLHFKSPQSFIQKTDSENVQSYIDLLPLNKRLWSTALIDGSVFRQLLFGLAKEMGRLQNLEYELSDTYIPNFDNSIIQEWEQVLGIPDSCFKISGQLDSIRRRNIIIKLAYMNLQTQDDYFALAALLGLDIQITYGEDIAAFAYTFPFPFLDSEHLRFVWYINIDTNEQGFPYTFDFSFGTSNASLFQCITTKQKPANTRLIFTFNPVEYTDGDGDFLTDGDGATYIAG